MHFKERHYPNPKHTMKSNNSECAVFFMMGRNKIKNFTAEWGHLGKHRQALVKPGPLAEWDRIKPREAEGLR